MKLNKTETILAIICLVLMFICFLLCQTELAGVFVFLLIVIIIPKGSLKTLSLFKLEFYPVEPHIFQLITESSEWIKSNLNINEINISQIPLYLQLNLEHSLTLTSPFNKNNKVIISNLKDFKEYTKYGYYGFTTIDNSLASKYQTLLMFFELLQRCKLITRKSSDNLEEIILSLKATELPCLLDVLNDEEVSMHRDDTIKEYLSTTIYETKLQNKYYAIIKKYPQFNEAESWSFWEIQRADFSNSDCEEIFVLCHYHSAGTLNFYYPLLIRHVSGRYDTIDIKYSSGFIEKVINFIQFGLFRLKLQFCIKIKRNKIGFKQILMSMIKK